MMKKHFVFAVAIPLLVGCIFGGSNNEVQNGPVPATGVVSIIDGRGLTNEGAVIKEDILAAFGTPAAAQAKLASRSHPLSDEDQTRETVCKYETAPVNASGLQLVSVGKLFLGIGEKNLEVPFEEKEMVYYGVLNKESLWPVGEYTVKGEGSAKALAFELKIKMPELLEEAKINGELIANGKMSLKYNTVVETTWKPSIDLKDDPIMIFAVYGEKSGTAMALSCEVRESEIKTSWTIPSEQLSKFPVGMINGKISLKRRILSTQKGGTVETVTLMGDRLYSTLLEIIE